MFKPQLAENLAERCFAIANSVMDGGATSVNDLIPLPGWAFLPDLPSAKVSENKRRRFIMSEQGSDSVRYEECDPIDGWSGRGSRWTKIHLPPTIH